MQSQIPSLSGISTTSQLFQVKKSAIQYITVQYCAVQDSLYAYVYINTTNLTTDKKKFSNKKLAYDNAIDPESKTRC